MIGRGYESRDPRRGEFAQCITNQPPPAHPLPSSHLERPSVSANPSTPRNTTVTGTLPTSSFPFPSFPSSLPSPTTTVVATTTAAATTVGGCSWCCTNTRGRGWSSRRIYVHVVSLQSFLFLEGGVLNGVVATLLLATEQVSPRL